MLKPVTIFGGQSGTNSGTLGPLVGHAILSHLCPNFFACFRSSKAESPRGHVGQGRDISGTCPRLGHAGQCLYKDMSAVPPQCPEFRPSTTIDQIA